jgi:hypothetical protein
VRHRRTRTRPCLKSHIGRDACFHADNFELADEQTCGLHTKRCTLALHPCKSTSTRANPWSDALHSEQWAGHESNRAGHTISAVCFATQGVVGQIIVGLLVPRALVTQRTTLANLDCGAVDFSGLIAAASADSPVSILMTAQ